MNKFFDTITNTRGDSLPNHRVQVLDGTGNTVTIYADKSGTRFTDATGAIVDYCTTEGTGRAEFYWDADTDQTLQVLDTGGNLVSAVADFADNLVVGALSGDLPQSRVTNLTTDLAAKAATATLASTAGAAGIGLALAGTLDKQLSGAGVYPITLWGGGPGKTAAENTAAIEAAWTALKDVGATIMIGPGAHSFNNSVFAAATVDMVIHVHKGATVKPANPIAGTYFWDFGTTFGNNCLSLEGGGIIEGIVAGSPSVCNGIVVGSANKSVYNLRLRNIKGTALKLIRPFNAVAEITTYGCGDWTNGRPAMVVCGSATEVFNDIRVGGTSEQDEYGWLFEAGTLLRAISTVKLHGGSGSYRALQIHRVAMFDFGAELTKGYAGTDFVHVSDSTSADSITLQNACSAASTLTRGTLRVNVQNGLDYSGTVATGNLMTLDMAGVGSTVAVIGDALAVTSTGGQDWRILTLKGGNAGARHDLSRLKMRSADATELSKLVNDARTTIRHKALPSAAGTAILPETAIIATSTNTRSVGEITLANIAAGVIEPPRKAMRFTPDLGTRSSRLLVPVRDFRGSRFQTITAAGGSLLIIPAEPAMIIEDTAPLSGAGKLSDIMVCAQGVAATYDAANHWEVDVYKGGSIMSTVKLSRSTTTAALDDGLPSRSALGNATLGYAFHFWNITKTEIFKADFVGAVLRPVGTPPDLTAITVIVNYEMTD